MQRSNELQKIGCADKLQHERLLVRATPEQHLLMSRFKIVETNINPDEEVGLGEVAKAATRMLAAEKELKVPVLTEGNLPVLAEAEAEAEAEDLVDRRLPSNNVHPMYKCKVNIPVSSVVLMDMPKPTVTEIHTVKASEQAGVVHAVMAIGNAEDVMAFLQEGEERMTRRLEQDLMPKELRRQRAPPSLEFQERIP